MAVPFGLIACTIFDEFQDRLGGCTVEAVALGSHEPGAGTAQAQAEPSLCTGVAYVSQGGFQAGEAWGADADAVLSRLREAEEGLSADAPEQPGVRSDPRAARLG